jgi:rubrerythrin
VTIPKSKKRYYIQKLRGILQNRNIAKKRIETATVISEAKDTLLHELKKEDNEKMSKIKEIIVETSDRIMEGEKTEMTETNRNIRTDITEKGDQVIRSIDNISEVLSSKQGAMLEKLTEVENAIPVFPESFRVSNLKDIDRRVEVVNLDEIKIPRSVKVSNVGDVLKDKPSWYKGATVNVFSTLPDKYVPVRLTDGKNFYKGIGQAVSNSFVQMLPFTTSMSSGGQETRALVDEDRHVQVDVLSTTEGSPTSPLKLNAGYEYTYDTGGNCIRIDMRTGSSHFYKTFSWTGSACTGETIWRGV